MTDAPAPTGALIIAAPLAGTVVALADVPDAVFAQELVGPGTAIEPAVPVGAVTTVVAPAAGTIGSLYPHAFALETPHGRTVLVHLGIDTVKLAGDGFTLHVAAGDEVLAGQALISWDPRRIAELGLPTVCPVVALQADPDAVVALVLPGALVQAGEPLLSWA